MLITSQRFSALVNKLRLQVIDAAKRSVLTDDSKCLVRLNKVFAIQRHRNLINGMIGKPWVNIGADTVLKLKRL